MLLVVDLLMVLAEVVQVAVEIIKAVAPELLDKEIRAVLEEIVVL